jgi:hypothetical protein
MKIIFSAGFSIMLVLCLVGGIYCEENAPGRYYYADQNKSEQQGSKTRGSLNLDYSLISNDNVYKTSGYSADTGSEININALVRTKYSNHTFTRLNYSFVTNGYNRYSLDNLNANSLSGLLKQRFGNKLTLDLKGGYKTYQFPNITETKYLLTQDFSEIYFRPNLDIYPSLSTTLRGEYINETISYPQYDLDHTNNGYQFKLAQDLGNSGGFLDIYYIIERYDYSERFLYAIVLGSETATGTKRYDNINTIKANFSYDIISPHIKLLLNCQQQQLRSNGNYFDFGPNQTRYNNTIFGDEVIVEDYYSYDSAVYGGGLCLKTRKSYKIDLNCSFKDTRYLGRLARDRNDQFITPGIKRHDQQTTLSAKAAFTLSKLLNINLSYSYEINDSNDYLNNYTNSIVSAGLSSWFTF